MEGARATQGSTSAGASGNSTDIEVADLSGALLRPPNAGGAKQVCVLAEDETRADESGLMRRLDLKIEKLDLEDSVEEINAVLVTLVRSRKETCKERALIAPMHGLSVEDKWP